MITTVVKEYNLVVEEQVVALGEAEAAGTIIIVSLIRLGQTKVALKEDGFLAAFIDPS